VRKDFQRNYDDGRSDPDLVATSYQVGRSAFLETGIVLGQFSGSGGSSGGGGASGGSGGSSGGASDGSGGFEGGGGGFEGGCPQLSQRLLTKDGYERCDKIYSKYLSGEDVFLLNPITGNSNRIVHLEVIDQPIVELVLQRAKLFCSESHRIIKNTQDFRGTRLTAADEVLAYTDNLYFDQIVEMTPKGTDAVLRIELEKEFIYVAEGVMSHNLKDEGFGGDLPFFG
jgi:hypothetical protein